MNENHLPHHHSCCENHEAHPVLDASYFEVAADVFKQLSDSSRLQIFWVLCHYEECVINISAMVDMSSPAVSHHLRILKDSGLIVSRRVGKEVFYKAANTETSTELHHIIEKIMALHCPIDQDSASTGATVTPDLEMTIQEIQQKLVHNLKQRFTIEELAEEYLVNTTTLKTTFKKIYGMPIASYMKKYRLDTAASMLRESTDSLAVIASAIGYESQGKFTKAFKDQFGCSPSEYRRNY